MTEPPPVWISAGAGIRTARLVTAFCAGGIVLAACASQPAARSTPPALRHAVGVISETLVDPARDTPANGAVAGHSGRTIGATIHYPAEGSPSSKPVTNAPVDRAAGPYPLVLFAPGFGADPAGYRGLLERWASAGYVVAGLRFPLTNAEAPGGPDLADFVNQPGDMSFAVTELLSQSRASGTTLAGLVDPDAVAAAGHSLGAVTTLGMVANTCCFDQRIKASVIMSGDAMAFPVGRTRYPPIPLLFVHGDADAMVPYAASVAAFDAADTPKALLTITKGGHSSPVDPTAAAFGSVVRTTVDFFDLYLKHDRAAAARLRSDAQPNTTSLVLAMHPGAGSVIALPHSATRRLRAGVRPSTGLTDGQQVEVSWQGYAPGVNVNILQCTPPLTGAQACDLSTADVGVADPAGAGTTLFTVHTGKIGAGTCDGAHPQCALVVNQGGSSSPSDSVIVQLTFKS